jgi:hypothetical protein
MDFSEIKFRKSFDISPSFISLIIDVELLRLLRRLTLDQHINYKKGNI